MITTLKGGVLLVVGGLVLAVVGAVTYLASQGTVTGQEALTVYTVVLTGVVGVGTAHAAGQAAANAIAAPAAPPASSAAAPAPGVLLGPVDPPAATPMSGG